MLRLSSRLAPGFGQKKMLTTGAYLTIRNSETLELQIPVAETQETISIAIPKQSTLGDLTEHLQQKAKLSNISYVCNQKRRLPLNTPVDILLNRYFFINASEVYSFNVEGQLFDYGKSDEIVEGITSLELPAVTKREVESYMERVNRWVEYHSGKSILDESTKIDAGTAAKVLVEAAVDPQPQFRKIEEVEAQWERLYWQVEDLKRKKQQADDICLKIARRRMSWGLVLLGGNLAFIWSGTYVFYSWDIMQPLAYFVSSIGAIILAAQFFKLGRPYSNSAYQQYLMDRLSTRVYKQVGFQMEELARAEYNLVQLEAIIKDYYLKKL